MKPSAITGAVSIAINLRPRCGGLRVSMDIINSVVNVVVDAAARWACRGDCVLGA
ncbi:hypothetical protein GCM10022198_09530 [Klugiella xanthotipulae]